eukprot:gnl/Dysnectes_brevis/7054_a11473_223.p1 GENE.gnl/Dysnectes_brevis/7054_a11473_223~~gnl/Dysnectes_brevis/7054_a11473_223.p1  ORF type:complete len:963 (-),score=318.00 gnl/Dysnectes_brevis/7054_a11473_223:75-2963(-)
MRRRIMERDLLALRMARSNAIAETHGLCSDTERGEPVHGIQNYAFIVPGFPIPTRAKHILRKAAKACVLRSAQLVSQRWAHHCPAAVVEPLDMGIVKPMLHAPHDGATTTSGDGATTSRGGATTSRAPAPTSKSRSKASLFAALELGPMGHDGSPPVPGYSRSAASDGLASYSSLPPIEALSSLPLPSLRRALRSEVGSYTALQCRQQAMLLQAVQIVCLRRFNTQLDGLRKDKETTLTRLRDLFERLGEISHELRRLGEEELLQGRMEERRTSHFQAAIQEGLSPEDATSASLDALTNWDIDQEELTKAAEEMLDARVVSIDDLPRIELTARKDRSPLEVTDEELAITRQLSPEEQAELARQRAAAGHDDLARRELVERALYDMMRGSLDATAEDSILDLPVPSGLDVSTDSLDQEAEAAVEAYRESLRLRAERRTKKRKSLEAEGRRVRQMILDLAKEFDGKLRQLQASRIRAQLRSNALELLANRLQAAAAARRQIRRESVRRSSELRQMRGLRLGVGNAISDIKREQETTQKRAAAFKQAERSFHQSARKEIGDMSSESDLLMAVFKSRLQPRQIVENLLTCFPSEMGRAGLGCIPSGSAGRQDIRPPLSRSRLTFPPELETDEEGRGREVPYLPSIKLIAQACPPGSGRVAGVSENQWERLCWLRAAKMAFELASHELQRRGHELSAAVAKLTREGLRLDTKLETLSVDESNARRRANAETLNVPLVALMTEGQVERTSDEFFVPDDSDTMILPKAHLDRLNSRLASLGGKRVEGLRSLARMRQRIRVMEHRMKMLEWKSEDLTVQIRDYQLVRVSRDMHSIIRSGSSAVERHSVEVKGLQRKLEHLRKSSQRASAHLDRQLQEIPDEIEKYSRQNAILDQKIADLKIKAAQRRVAMPPSSKPTESKEDIARKRFTRVASSRRLRDLSAVQKEEIEFLTAELERLRRRTYPSFDEVN